MTVAIKAVPFVNEKKYEHPWHSPQSFIIVGGVGSGKTSVMMSILNELSDNIFNYVYFFSGNNLDSNIDLLSTEVEVYGPDPQKLEEVLNTITRRAKLAKKEKKPIPRSLLIIDDLAGEPGFFTLGKSQFSSFMLSIRHTRTSVVTCTQKWKLINLSTRINASIIFTSRLAPPDWLALRDSLPFDKNALEKAYREATSEPYGFLQINIKRHLLIKGFDEILS